MGVSCQILINKPKACHEPAQQVTGVVKYAVDEPLEVKCVVLSLVGKGRCKWAEIRSFGTTMQTINYSGSEEYFIAFLDVIEKSSDEVVTIPVGSYEFPFEFFLPANIPPSYKDDVGHISYKLILKFKRPGIFRPDKKFTAEIILSSKIASEWEEQQVFDLEKTLTKPFSNRKHVVNVKIDIDKTTYTPEEKAHLSLIVTNDTNVTITAIKTELIRRISYTADCGKTKSSETTLRDSTVMSTSIPKDAVVNLRQEISTLPGMVSINSRVINVEFLLKVTARLPMPHSNASVEIPIIIGEKSEESSEVDPPPTYWQVMSQEEKVKE